MRRCPFRRDGRDESRVAGARVVPGAAWLFLGGLLLLAAGPAAAGEEEAPGSRAPHQLWAGASPCRFCTPAEGVPVVDLGEAGMDSLGREMTAANDAAWDRCDSLFRSGAFGDPGTREARERALVHFKLRARNAFHYLADLCGDSPLHGVTEADLKRPFGERYANTTVFPISFLRQGLIGTGGFCMRYEIGAPFDGRVMLGGVPVRIHADELDEDDAPAARPALSVQFSSELHKSIELLFLSEVCGQVRHETIVDRGDTLDLTTVTEISGMYARRGGAHRLGALIYWRSVTAGDRDPARPRAGAYAYFPHISLSLPLFLPDIGLDDLREFDLPNPVVSMDWVRAHPVKPWVRVSPDAFFIPWKAMGPVPDEVERRFPDL
jgi:hypothetical protein